MAWYGMVWYCIVLFWPLSKRLARLTDAYSSTSTSITYTVVLTKKNRSSQKKRRSTRYEKIRYYYYCRIARGNVIYVMIIQ